MTPFPFDTPGGIGIVQDKAPWHLPMEAWSNGKNFHFKNGVARRSAGYQEALGDPTGIPVAIFNVPASNDLTYWMVFTLAKAYVWESGVESEITNTGADYTATAPWQWGYTLLAGIPIFNNGIDLPQWWPAVSTGQELEDLPSWPAAKRARFIRGFGSYLVAGNITESGTNRPHKVMISAKASPGSVPSSWDETDATKDAVTFDLTDAEGGELLDGLPLGSEFIYYKKNSTHTMRFVGGQEIWGRDLLFESSGVLNTRCVCRADKGRQHFVATQTDIILHSGSKDSLVSVVEQKNRAAIFAELDDSTYLNSFVFEDEAEKKLYFCYPTTGSTYPNKAFVYNYENKTQGFEDWSGTAAARGVVQVVSGGTWDTDTGTWDSDAEPWAAAGREGILVCDPVASLIYKRNSGYTFNGVTPVAYLERTGLPAPPRKKEDRADFTSRKICSRIWPKITGTAEWTIQVGAQETRDGTITWSAVQTFNPATQQFLDVEANGRLLAVRFEVRSNVATTLEGFDLEISILGKH